MLESLFKGLTEEQIAKAKSCKSAEELLACAKKEGLELTEEQLSAVSGGCGGNQEKDNSDGFQRRIDACDPNPNPETDPLRLVARKNPM